MPSSLTPGSSITDKFQSIDVDIGLRRVWSGSALPKSRNPFRAGASLRGFTGSLPLRPVRLLAPLYGSDWNAQPPGAFTSRLSTDRSPSPLLDITTTVTGLLLLAGLSPAGMAARLAARSILHAYNPHQGVKIARRNTPFRRCCGEN